MKAHDARVLRFGIGVAAIVAIIITALILKSTVRAGGRHGSSEFYIEAR